MEITVNLKDLWKKFKYWIMLGLASIATSVWVFLGDAIHHYMHVQHMVEYKADLIESFDDEAVVDSLFSQEQFVDMFFESDVVKAKIKDLGQELHANVVDQVLRKDSNKVSTRDYIGAVVNMHPDSVLPFQAKVMKFFKRLEEKGLNLTTDKEFNDLKDVLENQEIRTEPRRRRRNPVVF